MPSIPLLERSDYDFSSVGAGGTVVIPLRQSVGVQAFGSGTLLFRLHAASLPTGASIQLEVRGVAPTDEDPATFFRGPLLAVAELTSASVAPTLSTGAARIWSANVAAFLRVRQGPGGGTFTFTVSADLDLSPQLVTWSPLDLGDKLRLWLDARDQVVVNGVVSDWGDQSAANNDFSMNTSAGRRPLYGVTINGQPAPSFDGTDDYMESGQLGTFISASAYHVFLVVRFDSITLNGQFSFNNHNIFADVAAAWCVAVGTPGVQAMHWDTGPQTTPAIPVVAGVDYLIEWSFDGATIRCQVGAAAAQSIAAGNVVATNNAVRLGFGYAGAGYLDGCIASVVCSNQYLAAVDVQNVRAYLSTRYGVPA